MADWEDDDHEADIADLDVLEASSRLSFDELSHTVSLALLYRKNFNPDMPPPHFAKRFEVRGVVGKGGYGCVFRAWDTRLHRDVAIKLCAVDPRVNEVILLAEARALARLSHPNIVTVHECDRHADKLFLVMEYVRGGTLAQFVPKRSGGVRRARSTSEWQALAKVFAEVARALARAHKQGVIHGDVKPDNVLLDDEDLRPRVADFGLARIVGAPTLIPDAVGTVPYGSPELLEEQKRDEHSDMWAFIVALYECIEGKLPAVDTDEKIPSTERRMLRALEAWTGPTQFGDDVPAALVEIVKTGLSFKREDRFPDMDAIADALENVFISGLMPGAIVEPAAASDEVVLEPAADTDTDAAGGKKGIKGAGIAVLLAVAIGGLLAELYVVRHSAEIEQPNQATRPPTPAERGQQKIQAASEIVKSTRILTDQKLDLVEELWRQGVDLIRLSDKLSDKDLASKLTLDLAAQIQARKQGTKQAASLAIRSAQWREAEGQWNLAVEAQEQAVEVYKTAVDAPELGEAEDCLASLEVQVRCENRAAIEP